MIFLPFEKFYNFHFLGREKPNLVELGPYMYRQKLKKADIRFSEDGEEVSHSVYREFYFESSYNPNVSENDVVIVPNIPIFGLIKKSLDKSAFEKAFTRSLIESYSSEGIDTGPFIKVTVKEFFWGYPSILLSMQRQQESTNCKGEEEDLFAAFKDFGEDSDEATEESEKINCDIKRNNLVPFGLFSIRNSSSQGTERTIKTGKGNPALKGSMVSWNGMKKLNYWSDQCNNVDGRDPGGLPLTINKSEVLNLFIGQLCRSLNFTYDSKVIIENEFQGRWFSSTYLHKSFNVRVMMHVYGYL